MKISPEKIDEMFPNEGEDFATMLSRSEQSEDNVLREGKIVKIDDESVMIDVQDKKEGRMSIDEIKILMGIYLSEAITFLCMCQKKVVL